MNISKKHIILGLICFISVLLQSVPGIATFVPYMAFCLCSFAVGLNCKKGRGIITVILFGLIGLPVFDFVYSLITVSLMTSLFANTLILLAQACVYIASFILVNSWMNNEKFSLSLITGILAINCIVVYAFLEGSQIMALSNAFHQAVEQSTLVNWANVVGSGNIFVDILSNIMFYVALWCTSIRFMKEK